MFAHYEESRHRGNMLALTSSSTPRKQLLRREGRPSIYQSTVSHEQREFRIFSLVDLLLQNAESHWLFNNIVIVRDIALINAALEKFGRIMATGG